MTIDPAQQTPKLSWRFPRTFWFANGAELFERAAYYGMFITLQRYLNQDIGFGDVSAGFISGTFSGVLYFLPTFMGIMADRIGFRKALVMAFSLLTVGYFVLGIMQLKVSAIAGLVLILFGGAIVKPVITGTVAKCSDSLHRARAMSLFYMMVNIGSFSGKFLAGHTNDAYGLNVICLCGSGMAFAALILVVCFYRDVDTAGQGKTLEEALQGLGKVLCNFRFLSLIVIVGGFWAIQVQLYSSMPTYVERLLGQGHKPEWLANINPLVVVLLVVPITHLVRNLQPPTAIGISLLIIPFTALAFGLAPSLQAVTGDSVAILGLTVHPMVLLMIVGIGLQGLAECFLSPKFLEYASKQAPPGEVGLYLGYQHLTSFFSWMFGFISSGYLLKLFCPDPRTLSEVDHKQWQEALAGTGSMPEAYAHAHYLWFFYVGVGVLAFLALLVFIFVTGRVDRRRQLSNG